MQSSRYQASGWWSWYFHIYVSHMSLSQEKLTDFETHSGFGSSSRSIQVGFQPIDQSRIGITWPSARYPAAQSPRDGSRDDGHSRCRCHRCRSHCSGGCCIDRRSCERCRRENCWRKGKNFGRTLEIIVSKEKYHWLPQKKHRLHPRFVIFPMGLGPAVFFVADTVAPPIQQFRITGDFDLLTIDS